MPTFETLPVKQAKANSISGKRAKLLREYMDFIEQVPHGHAGKLEPAEGETTNAVRRRIGAAAAALGKSLTIRRVENAVYFWIATGNGRRRGRRADAKT